MNITRIFVSSTCYDLAGVRESLRKCIKALGHEPILSEYPSFPVLPDESAISNCRLNVRKNSDLLVLIIGGRRGHLEPVSLKSVTNLEYEEAKAAGKPCFVFVSKKVLSLLPIWEKNSDADFTPEVDYPAVFEFIKRIREESRWTFSFETCQEIEETLGIQLSGMMRDLIARSCAGTLDPLLEFQRETKEAQRLVRDKPRFWEYLLSGELLRSKLAVVRRRSERIKSGHTFIRSSKKQGQAFLAWSYDQFADLKALGSAFTKQVNEYQNCWGPSGVAADPNDILQATDGLVSLVNEAVSWEERIHSIRTHDALNGLRGIMATFAESIILQAEDLQHEIGKPFENGTIPEAGTKINISLTLGVPDVEAFSVEVNRLADLQMSNPLHFVEIWSS